MKKFWLHGYHSGYTEMGYFDFIPFPKPFAMTIVNRYKAAGRQTVLDLFFTIDLDVAAGSDLVIRFDTNNQLYQMFADDLEGEGTNGATYRYLDCN